MRQPLPSPCRLGVSPCVGLSALSPTGVAQTVPVFIRSGIPGPESSGKNGGGALGPPYSQGSGKVTPAFLTQWVWVELETVFLPEEARVGHGCWKWAERGSSGCLEAG